MITFPAETSRSHTLAASRTLSSGEPSSPQPSSCRRKTTTFYLSVLFLFLAIIPCVYAAQIEVQADGSTIPPATSNDEGFGVDASWPMQRYDPSKLLRKDAYQDYMEGCYQHANERTCDFNDEERLELNAHQPPKMANYTAAGYAKLKLPGDIREIFDIAWETNSPHRMRNERYLPTWMCSLLSPFFAPHSCTFRVYVHLSLIHAHSVICTGGGSATFMLIIGKSHRKSFHGPPPSLFRTRSASWNTCRALSNSGPEKN